MGGVARVPASNQPDYNREIDDVCTASRSKAQGEHGFRARESRNRDLRIWKELCVEDR